MQQSKLRRDARILVLVLQPERRKLEELAAETGETLSTAARRILVSALAGETPAHRLNDSRT